MKKLVFALVIFAACKSPGEKSAEQKEVRPAEVVATREESKIIPAPKSTAEPRKEDLVRSDTKPTKENSAAPIMAAPAAVSKEDEIRQEQKSDSTLKTDQGGGSDFEGYIPFIKQFFDR